MLPSELYAKIKARNARIDNMNRSLQSMAAKKRTLPTKTSDPVAAIKYYAADMEDAAKRGKLNKSNNSYHYDQKKRPDREQSE
jgi:hypothetical protein